MKEECLESIEDMLERFSIMTIEGNISEHEAKAYVINHAKTSILKAKAIGMKEFEINEV